MLANIGIKYVVKTGQLYYNIANHLKIATFFNSDLIKEESTII
jgi:hypothetical protein